MEKQEEKVIAADQMQGDAGIGHIARAAAVTGMSYLIVFLLGIGKGKATALFTGTEGVGLLATVTSFQALLVGVACFGVSLGLTRYISEYLANRNYDGLARLLKSGFLTVVTLSSLIIVFVLFLRRQLSLAIVGDTSAVWYILFASASVPMSAISSYYGGILIGARQIKSLATISIGSAVASMIFTLPLVFYLGLAGIVFQVVLSALFTLIVSFLYGHRKVNSWHLPKVPIRFHFGESIRLLKYGSFSFSTGIFHQFTLLFVQVAIIQQSGLSENGLFQSGWSIWWPFMSVAMSSVSVYVLPAICGTNDELRIRKLVNNSLRFLLLLTTPIVVVSMTFSGELLGFVYSSEFSDAGLLLQLMLVGTTIRLCSFPFSMQFIAKGHLRVSIVSELLWYASFGVAFYVFLPFAGISSTGIAVLLSQVIYALFMLLSAKRILRHTYGRENVMIVSASVVLPAVMFISILTMPTWSPVVLIVGLVLWMSISINGDEREHIISRLRKLTV